MEHTSKGCKQRFVSPQEYSLSEQKSRPRRERSINSPKNSKIPLYHTPYSYIRISVEYSLHKTMSSSSSSEDDDEDLFYAPSYNRKREEEKKNKALGTASNTNVFTNNTRKVEEEEEEERKRTRALISDSDADADDDDDDDDESDDEKDDEEEKEEEKPTSIIRSALVSESSDSDAPPSTVARRDRAQYNDEKMREASALMRELTKKTDARVFEDENDGDEQHNGVASSDDGVGALGANAEDDEDEDDMRYEPIQLVFAFSNTNKVEFETSKRYTFERIWKDFVDEHHPEGDVAKAKFTFDGDRIEVSEDTPETLDMDDEDVVDVLL